MYSKHSKVRHLRQAAGVTLLRAVDPGLLPPTHTPKTPESLFHRTVATLQSLVGLTLPGRESTGKSNMQPGATHGTLLGT